MNRLYVMDLPERHAAAADAPSAPQRAEGDSCRRGRPTARSIVYVTWTTTGGHIKRVAATGGAAADADRARGLLPRSRVHAGRHRASSSWPAPRRTSCIRSCWTRRRRRADGDEHAPREIGGVSPPNTLEIRWMPADGRRRRRWSPRRRAGAARISRATTTRASTSRPIAACSRSRIDGYDRRTLLPRHRASARATTRRRADDIRLSPDGTRAFVNLQGRHYLVTVPRAGRETVEVRIQGRGDNAAVPVKRMSLEGGDYLHVDRATARPSPGRGARSSSASRSTPTEPQKTDVVVELPRARPKGSVLLTGARIITMKGDEVIAQGDVLVTDNRIAAVGKRGIAQGAGRHAHDQRRRQDDHAGPGRRALAHVGAARAASDRGLAVPRQPRLRRDDDARSADVDARRVRLRRHGGRRHDAGPARLCHRARACSPASGIDAARPRSASSSATRRRTSTNTLKQYVAGDRIVRQWIIEACKEYGITATIEGSLDLKLNLTQMADGYSGQEHSLPIMPLYKDVDRVRRARPRRSTRRRSSSPTARRGAENYWFETENAGQRRQAAASGCRGSCSTTWCAAARSGSCPRSTATR